MSKPSALHAIAKLWHDQRAISLVEFGLLMPIFLGTVVAGIDMSQLAIATQRMQRLSANMGDLVAQSGTASIGASEAQINDIFLSLDYAAKPFKLRDKGRVIVTAVQGVKNGAGVIQNRKLWHRCDGSLTGRPNNLPGAIGGVVGLPNARVLLDGEIMIHSQLVYEFEPLMNFSIGSIWPMQTRYVERTAMFRPRSKTFVSITPDGATPKSACPTS